MNTIALTIDQIIVASAGALIGMVITWLMMQRQYRLGTALKLSEQEQSFQVFKAELEQQLSIKNEQLLGLERQRQTLEEQLQQSSEQLSASQQKQTVLTSQCAELQVMADQKRAAEQQLQEQQAAHTELLSEHRGLQATREQELKQYKEQLALIEVSKEQLSKEFERVAHKIFDEKQEKFTKQSKSTLDLTINPLKEQLSAFREKVETVYEKENAERNKLVGQISELQKQTQQIGEDAVNLAKALKGDNKAQGNWGEVILERLLEESGLQKGREYETQVSLTDEDGGRRNPDVIVRLPENKDIIIDAKVSLVDYERFCSTENLEEQQAALKGHINSLRGHINQLSVKSYESLEGIRSLDFVFIFVPVEAAFMTALQHEPGLFREAYDKQIILVSPTTLLATLRTVENIWRYEKQNKNAEKIAKQAGALYDQFVLLLSALEDVGKHLSRTQEAYEVTQKRLSSGRGNLIKRVEDVKRLGAKTKKQISSDKLELAEADDYATDLKTLALEQGPTESDEDVTSEPEA